MRKGYHGGVNVSPLVRAEARDRLEPVVAARVVLLLEEVELPYLTKSHPDADRVQLALLKLSEGSFARFLEELNRARNDWRDVLDTAGLHHPGWRDVVRSWGYRVPEESGFGER
ncbi:MAG: hypothetical protein ACRD16_14520 [Thermoanaerobaculia bacterium]